MTMQNDTQPTIAAIATFVGGRFPALAASGAVTADAPLLASGAMDSLGIVELMAFIEERFGVDLSDADLDESHFESVRRLATFVDAKRGLS